MPRPVSDQVVVITGASSGIGYVTARLFASRGARLVLGARNIEALNGLADEINRSGGIAVPVETDVSRQDDVEMLAATATDRFGRIDTWVNNAGVSLYATFDKVSDEEARRIMDVNFMGTLYGMQAALHRMRASGGGTIVNVASVTGKRAIPLQSVYSASKYAIVGLGEAVRAELVNSEVEINVCTVCPPSINTPFFDHAKTKEGYAPKPMAPVYDPETVAEAIVDCAENPQREVLVGTAGKAFALINTLAPGLTDWFMGKAAVSGQLTDEPKLPDATNNLFDVPADGQERGGWTAWGTKEYHNGGSAFSRIQQHPLAASVVGLAVLAIATRYLLK